MTVKESNSEEGDDDNVHGRQKPLISSSMIADASSSSALMSKIGAFLPVMAAANKELEEKVALGDEQAKNVRIDTMLERDQHSGEEEDVVENEKLQREGETTKEIDGVPTIEMTVALGDFDSNPVVSLLEGDKNEGQLPEGSGDESNDVILHETNMIHNRGADAPPLLSARSSRRKKPLIQEISKP